MVQRQSSRPTRLEDVAEAAGVHVSTVSRVLNGRQRGGGPAGDARADPGGGRRVCATGRTPWRAGLKLASAGALGLLVPSLRNPVYSAIIRGAFDRAWERDFVVLLAEDLARIERPAGVRAAGRGGSHRRPPDRQRAARQPAVRPPASTTPIPCVFVNRRHLGSGRNVAMREEDAGRIAAEHLLGLGHTRLAHIAGPPRAGHGAPPRRRVRRGRARGRPSLPPWSPAAVRRARRAGGDEGAARAARRRRPGCSSRTSTRPSARIAGARCAGRSIPADLSLVGYDDDPLCECLEVPLTAIRMPLSSWASRAVDCARSTRSSGSAPRDISRDAARARGARRRPPRPSGRMRIRAAVMEQRRAGRSWSPTWSSTRRAATRCWCACWRRASAAATSRSWTASGPSPLPIVLGHEGAGMIEAVGEGVDQARIGERVVLTFAPPCGTLPVLPRGPREPVPRGRGRAWTRARCATARPGSPRRRARAPPGAACRRSRATPSFRRTAPSRSTPRSIPGSRACSGAA